MADDSINFQFTAKGQQLASQALAGTVKLDFTKAVASTDNHFSDSAATIAALTTLANVKQTATISEVEQVAEDDTEVRIPVTFDKSQVGDDYQLLTVGLYCKPDNGAEVLYAVAGLANPILMHKSLTSSVYSIAMYVFVGTADNVTIKVNPAGAVTHADLTTILGDYAKTGDVNQQLDKKVNVSDMRKPASDVAGIEEVNAKQDKIGYTPADDSKVVHTTDTSNWQKQAMFNPGDYVTDATNSTTDFATLLRSKYNKPGVVYIRDNTSFVDAVVICEGNGWWHAYGPNAHDNFMHRRIRESDDTGWVIIADDSKVAHLSGANNFDTVPTVNNNPLLLASSLPSDLARTGSDQEFTGKNTFDVAPIDKKTGNPYITAKAPGIPKLAVKYNATSKAFDYTLTAPEKDGLSDIIQYNLLWKDHSVDDWTTVIVKPDTLTGQLTGVDITKTYDFKSAAQNAVGSSDSTDVITLGTAAVPGIPSLTVEYNAGKKGFDYTVTAPESDGGSEITGYSLEYQKQGGTDWTKVALKPDILTGTVTDGIEVGSDYLFRVNAENTVGSSNYFTVSDPVPTVDGNIYGVSWDGSSSGVLKRTDAAVGLKAGINGAQNDFDTRGPWGLMDKTVTDSYGNAFVRVPKFYIRKTQDKSKPLSTWQVSLVKQGDDWYLPNCFYDFGNKKELNYVDVSRYEGSIASGKLQSKTGVTPTSSVDINHFRTSATALNVNGKKGYHLWDVHTLDALQVLFTIEFATLDSQSIMKGVTDSVLAGAEATGATDGVKGSSGNVNHSNGYGSMTYRGIENLYGNLAMWTDGLNISNLSLYSCDDATKYASDVFTSPYYKLNYSLQSMTSGNSNITGLGFDKDHLSVEAPISSNNDQYNTYYHDYSYVNGSGNYVVDTGGGWNWDAGLSGLWFWIGYSSSTGAVSNVGSRLLKKAL